MDPIYRPIVAFAVVIAIGLFAALYFNHREGKKEKPPP
jgi:hypothetical protein